MNKHFFSKLKRRLTRHRNLVRGLFITSLLGIFIFSLYAVWFPTKKLVTSIARGPATAFSLVRDPAGVLRSMQGRTNILLLGMGGANHEGPELTDSIVIVSVDLSSVDTVILSVPRDIYVDSLKTKINAVYYYGEQKKENGGLVLVKSAVEEVVGQPVHYALAVDFNGFKRAIDLIGGIEINVPETFDDYKYPIPGMEDAEPEEKRYEHLHFEAGLQKMGGETALKYVRSRNAEGNQGTDFSRSKRQQQVLTALKDEILSLETMLSPSKLRELVNTFSDSIRTDLQEQEYLSLAKLAIQSKTAETRQGLLEANIENPEAGLLINPPSEDYSGQWVLTGKNNSWQEVHDYVEKLFYQK